MLARLAAFVFSVIQTLFILRLVLPYVKWPSSLNEWVPRLIDVTDMLAAPFQPLVKTFDLKSATSSVPALGSVLNQYVNKVDAGIVVAMIGWGVIAFVVLLIVQLVNRAR